MTGETRFSFGENWLDFVNNSLDKKRIDDAISSLITMLKMDDLSGKTFLDVGCGSGMFSLAACLLNAKHVYSFDFDSSSVLASKKIKSTFQIPDSIWEIDSGDILDNDWLVTVPNSDIVYSWGVLHHTGSMWKAIDNTISKVNPGGLLSISIYNRVNNPRDSSEMWWKVKKIYNKSPKIIQKTMVYLFILKVIQRHIRDGRNPIKEIKSYGERGMNFFHDARDWVGGFPYEFASVEEILKYIETYKHFKLEFLNPVTGNACNEFTFRYSL